MLPNKFNIIPFVILFVVALPCISGGEETVCAPTRKSIYLELLGPGLLYSINYDNNFGSSYVGRIGLSVYPKIKDDTVEGGPVLFIPLTGSYLIRKSQHQKYEIGAGAVITTETWKEKSGKLKSMTSVLGTITWYWCYSPKSKGIYYRLGVIPLFGKDIGDPSSPNYLVTGGAAIGYSF